MVQADNLVDCAPYPGHANQLDGHGNLLEQVKYACDRVVVSVIDGHVEVLVVLGHRCCELRVTPVSRPCILSAG